jgi:glycosyltransferase involved in cell wall biosynthesis/peptidoglycan/xylan/chitin deacetylase (PgdA/CDA1 family)
MSAPPKLSVIISTFNRCQVLVSQCLPSILNQDLPTDQYEVIVIVDGSTDGTAEALREFPPSCALRIVEQPNAGLSKARNTGLAMAKAELVMFIDDDIVCRADVLRRHVDAHAGKEPVVFHGAIYLAPGTRPSILANANEAWYRRYNRRLAEHGGAIWPEGVFLISNSSTPRSTLIACGGFDEILPAMDDFEVGLRLWKAGVKFQYLPDAVAYELSVKSWRSFLFKDGEAFGTTEVLLCRKYPDYRLRSGLLSGLGRTVSWRRVLRRVAMQSPVSPAYLLAPPIWVCEKLCRFPALQKAGLFLLEVGRRFTELRAALREAGCWKDFHTEFALRLPVLLYHHVGPARPGTNSSLTVSPIQFERQVRWLTNRGFHGIRPADWLRWRREGKGLKEKPVLLTFDDGYADLAEYALQVLHRYGFGAAVYIVTSEVGGTNTWDDARGSATHRLLSAEQIRHWAERGIEFGAHSRTHIDLADVSPGQLRDEVVGSADDLGKILGRRAVSFAYPYGFHSPAVVECVRETFELAFAVSPQDRGINDLPTDPHLLRRTMVQPGDSVVDIACRVHWGYSPLQELRANLRLRSRFNCAVHAVFGGSRIP